MPHTPLSSEKACAIRENLAKLHINAQMLLFDPDLIMVGYDQICGEIGEPLECFAGEDYSHIVVSLHTKVMSVRTACGEEVVFDIIEDGIKENLRSIAIKAYWLFGTTDRNEVSVAELFETGALSRLVVKSIEGEDYSDIIVQQGAPFIEVSRIDGRVVVFDVKKWLLDDDEDNEN